MRISVLLAACAVLAVGGAAAAQDLPGDPKAGRAFAEEACASCHITDPDEFGFRQPDAPSFQEIADTPGMSPMALIAWLNNTPHPTMPNLMLSPDEAKNVVSYILTLQESR